MKRVYLLSVVLLGLIIAGPIIVPRIIGDNTYDIRDRFGPFRKVIITDKETYILGEEIETSFLVINDAAFPIFVKPLNEFSVSGNSVNNPEKSSIGIDSLYEKNFRIEIPAYGNSSFFPITFTPQYPGEFVIKWMEVKKTVEVTGYKEVFLNSTCISLVVIPARTDLKDRDYIAFNLTIINDNPYPVKVPVFHKIPYSLTSDTPFGGVHIDWIWSHFKIEANTQHTVWSRKYFVRYPGFSLYFDIDGVKASIELEVDP